MNFTLVVNSHDITIENGRSNGARHFYITENLRYFVSGALNGRKAAALQAMMSHAYERGEKLSSLRAWVKELR